MAYNYDNFTKTGRRVLENGAPEEAHRLNHNYIGTEHILLGLLREREGLAARVLGNLGVELNKVRIAVEFIITRGDRRSNQEIGFTPRAKKVIELTIDEARRLKSSQPGTGHILLGLVREGEGIAAGILESLGITLERVREETYMLLLTDEELTAEMRKTVSHMRVSTERLAHLLAEKERREEKRQMEESPSDSSEAE